MKQPGYYEKRDHSFEVDKSVKKVLEKERAPKGAKKYIEMRKAQLKKNRGY